MDFFEAQARAKQRTSRLVSLFGLAVVGTIAAMYFASWFMVKQAHEARLERQYRHAYAFERSAEPLALWQPKLFMGVACATIAVIGLGSLFKWSQFSAGGRAVAESVGGRRVAPNTRDPHERRLMNVVEEMAIASGVPTPSVYILDDEPGINAFAAGLTTGDAVVAVTRGTMEKLSRDELQGVVAHEFSHILNGDMRLNLRIAATIFGILVLGLLGRGILWSLRGVRVRGKNGGGVVAAIVISGVTLLVIGYVGYFFGRLIQAAVSRQREFLADASAVQFTRNPGGIAGALKKIGGYALGSSVNANQSAALGHFFFAQAFRSGFSGLWATHPPLAERIRAIEPSFDGKYFTPPQVVDVGRESFVSAGLAPGKAAAGPAGSPPVLGASAALEAVASIGALTPQQLANAQSLLDGTPAALRRAAQDPELAPALMYGLLFNEADTARARQRGIVARHDPAAAAKLDGLDGSLRELRPEHLLPLVQLAMPALKLLPSAALPSFLGTLDELVHADERVTPFEYVTQRLLIQALSLEGARAGEPTQYFSFQAVVTEIGVVLSVLARFSSERAGEAPAAFAAGARHLKLIEATLRYDGDAANNLELLDAALAKLAASSLPIKQRTLIAAAHVVQADGQVRVCELELLRGIAAALDVPMPPLAT